MTTVVTNVTGGRASPAPAVYVPPDREVVGSSGQASIEAGVDTTFVADLLSACLAHERCGVHLYRSVAGRTADAELRAQYEHFGAETLGHVAKLEDLISSFGGDPQYVSVAARATEKGAAGLLESTFIIDGSLDPVTAELTMLEAVMLAEAKDHANWALLAELTRVMPRGDVRSKFEEVTAEVLAQEDEHYSWATTTRASMLQALATGSAPSPDSTADSDGEPTKEELYHQAQELGIGGRSRMTRSELLSAVNEAKGAVR